MPSRPRRIPWLLLQVCQESGLKHELDKLS